MERCSRIFARARVRTTRRRVTWLKASKGIQGGVFVARSTFVNVVPCLLAVGIRLQQGYNYEQR